jgi:predicted chitinase
VKLEQLISIGQVRPGTAALFIDPLNNAMSRFHISTPKRQAGFVGQLLHESAGLSRVIEKPELSSGCPDDSAWVQRALHQRTS